MEQLCQHLEQKLLLLTLGIIFYVIGGFDKTGKVLDTVEVYDIKNDSWKAVAPLPQPLHHTTASSFKDKIYVIGGYTNNNWHPSAKLFIYDPKKIFGLKDLLCLLLEGH